MAQSQGMVMASKRKREPPQSIIQKLMRSFRWLWSAVKRNGKKLDNIDMGHQQQGAA